MAKYLNVVHLTKDQKQALVEVLKSDGFKDSIYTDSNEGIDKLDLRDSTLGIYSEGSDLNVFNFIIGNVNSFSNEICPEITLQDFFNEHAPSWATSLQELSGTYYWVNMEKSYYTEIGYKDNKWYGRGCIKFHQCLFWFNDRENKEDDKSAHGEFLYKIDVQHPLANKVRVEDCKGNEIKRVTCIEFYTNTVFVTTVTSDDIYNGYDNVAHFRGEVSGAKVIIEGVEQC